ncbi:MAG TPA: hypothetical protein VEP68_12790, partial [Anaeromyxobacteraceae bacterium]|nr:hypothetical protein [Anaeromyxobacteraceae bacterium]
MIGPTVTQALGLGWRAAVRNAWLAPVGLLAALARTVLVVPAVAFAWSVAVGAARQEVALLTGPEAILAAAVDAVTAPRAAAVVAGLWASASLLAAAVRLAWLAGALPTLGRTLA